MFNFKFKKIYIAKRLKNRVEKILKILFFSQKCNSINILNRTFIFYVQMYKTEKRVNDRAS